MNMMDTATPGSQINFGLDFSNSQTPSRPRHSKKAEKQTARQIREAQQKSLSFHSKRLCQHSDWDYIRSHEADFPFQREAEPAKESILALKNNSSYSQSGIIQSYGKINLGDDICSCCARVFALGRRRTWKGCVSFPIDLTYLGRPEGSVPFKGQCANCHWGGQGWKCSLRVGGVKIPPRRQRADLFQGSAFTHTHLGSKHDLNTMQGCADARQELQGIINQLSRRISDLQSSRKVDPVGNENARYDGDDGDDAYVGPADSHSIPQFTSTRQTRQNQPSSAPHTSSRNVVITIEDDDDDDDYVGPRNTQSVSQTISNRRTRRSSNVTAPSSSRLAVVIPSLRPRRHRSTRKASSL